MTNAIGRPPITPAQHAFLDYGVAAMFFGLAYHYRHRNPSASALALTNGAMVLGVSLFTDYPGGVWKRLPFATHGTLDAVQAALAGTGPHLFGFADQPEAHTFQLQALSEAAVIAATDWDAGRNEDQFAL